MTTYKKIILLAALLGYVGVLYGYFMDNSLFMMISAMVYGVLLLVFALLKYTGETPETRKTMEELREEKQTLEAKVETLTEEKERYAKAMEEAVLQKEQAAEQERQRAEQERQKAEQALEEAAQKSEEWMTILPPGEATEEKRETIDIIQIARQTVEELKPFAQKVHLEIQISAPEESILVKADPSRIRIMFRNIIDNSIKYMNRAGRLVITISNLGDDIFIVLKDNGNGLPEKETEHIFELNYQGSNRISGNGLGLTQAKAIVNSYGGTIYAKSNVGKGMGIYVQLPTD